MDTETLFDRTSKRLKHLRAKAQRHGLNADEYGMWHISATLRGQRLLTSNGRLP